jgi:RNA polymerase sigma factor (sigma-70 family)
MFPSSPDIIKAFGILASYCQQTNNSSPTSIKNVTIHYRIIKILMPEREPQPYQPTHTEFTDELKLQLYDSLVAGDLQTAGKLFNTHLQDEIYRYLVKRDVPSNYALDYTTETLLKAVDRFSQPQEEPDNKPELRKPLSIRSYFLTIADNIAKDHFRKASRFLDIDGVKDADHIFPQLQMQEEKEDNITDKQQLSLVMGLIHTRLTDDQKQVIKLRFQQGLSHEEIAIQLGKKVNAIRALQYRGINIIKDELSEQLPDNQRTALILNQRKFPIEEIAAILNISVDDVSSLLPQEKVETPTPPKNPKEILKIDSLQFQTEWESAIPQKRGRETLELIYADNQTIEEAAENMKISPNTVRVHLLQAINKLTISVWTKYIQRLNPEFEDHKKALGFALEELSYEKIAEKLNITEQEAVRLVEKGVDEVRKLFPSGNANTSPTQKEFAVFLESDEIQSRIKTLTPYREEVLRLFYTEGLSREQIAQLKCISEEAVKNVLYLARKQIAAPADKTVAQPHFSHIFQREEVQLRIRYLNPSEKNIILLRYRDGLSYQEIALETQTSIGNVQSSLSEARKKLTTPIPFKRLFKIKAFKFRHLWGEAGLSEREKQMLVLKHQHTLTPDEIAKKMNISKQTIYSHTSGILKKLTKTVWITYTKQLSSKFSMHKKALSCALEELSYEKIAEKLNITEQEAVRLVEKGVDEVRKLFPTDNNDSMT